MNRRDFLRTLSFSAAAASVGFSFSKGVFADPSIELAPHHLIPVDKNLPAQWLRKLLDRGAKEVWRADELRYIAMPIGGIGTGQLYLCGDGSLGGWEIFNQHLETMDLATYVNPIPPAKPFPQGFAVLVEDESGMRAKPLDKEGFPGVRFNGRHPIAEVEYEETGSPVRVSLEAFSPFIPLDEKSSGLPATILHYTVSNTTDRPQRVSILGWLANPVCYRKDLGEFEARRGTEIVREEAATFLTHSANEIPREPADDGRRPPEIIADFEKGHFGDWMVEGTAFGPGPIKGFAIGVHPYEVFEDNYYVTSQHWGDESTGRMTSSPFEITREFLNFRLGGGDHPGTAAQLLVDGEVVRSTSAQRNLTSIWFHWNVAEFAGRKARIRLIDEVTEAWGYIVADNFELADEPKSGRAKIAFSHRPDLGTLTLASAHRSRTPEEAREAIAGAVGLPENLDFSRARDGDLTEEYVSAMLTEPVDLQPGESRVFPFILTWHFANYGEGRQYASRFDDAPSVARDVLARRESYTELTRRWRDTWYESTLPYWLLDRVHSTATALATGTCEWWRNGRFWAWEGVRCCGGTCTHVWNYAQSLAWLFPALERTVREMQDYGEAFDRETGLVGFRGGRRGSIDGQCGTILKTYREHRMSADDSFLRRHWSRVKEAMRFAIREDENGDGLITKAQHNTYDFDLHGANTFVGSLYLAALRAAEEMAHEMGDEDFAREVRPIYESGRKKTVEQLWDGEYFFQDVDLEKYPLLQYGPGCLADQMFGQTWAHLLGLGHIYPPGHVNRALESVWKYNWAPDVGPYREEHETGRFFAEEGEAGLFICTWPKSPLTDMGVAYRNENWTGTEYQVAAGMIAEGLLDEALSICRAVHERYHPGKRNPYNEIECGDHYARALASWGVLLALAGHEFHGPKGFIAFAPRVTPDDFRCAFTSAKGWGAYSQRREEGKQVSRIELRYGELLLNAIRLAAPGGLDVRSARLGDRTIPYEARAGTITDPNQKEAILHIMVDRLEMREQDFLEVTIA